jgi:hypothetical protein
MSRIKEPVKRAWKNAGGATRLWWCAVAALGLAGVLLIGAVVIAGAGASSAPAPMGDAPPLPKPSTSSAPASMAPTTPVGATGGMMSAGTFCPNVQGAMVMPNGMVMAPVPASPPTASETAAAAAFVAEVQRGIAGYTSLASAEAAGYVPVSHRHGTLSHYLNRMVVKQGDVLDPSHPSALMYANTVSGPVLVGAMFLGPAPCEPGPDFGGSLTQWHAHDNLCLSGGMIVGRSNTAGTCAVGSHDSRGYFMLHVWTAPQLASKYQFKPDLPTGALHGIITTGQA